jgi:steroid delta-isomerase-like uncharacterized protein
MKEEVIMSLDQNKQIVRRILDEFWIGGNAGVLDELLASDCTNHELSRDPVRGRDRYKEWATGFRQVTAKGFPDLTITLEELVAEGDLVAKRWTFRGTHTGDYMGIPPTGQRVTMTGITIYRVANGRVQETWWNYDALGMLQQMGVIPAPQERVGASA